MDDTDGLVYASFNLQNINAPVPLKWKHNNHILEEYKKFGHSCQRIFDGPMAHVTRANLKLICFSFGVVPMGKTLTTISNLLTTRCMILTR